MSAPTQSGASETARTGHAWYVYGIVPEDVEPAEQATGVGDPPSSVDVVRHAGIGALVSEIDVSKPLGTPEDLLAHQQLLDGTVTVAPVLPFRFGAVLDGRQAVVDELLAPHHDEFAATLAELEGRAEFVVKGRYVQEAILRDVLESNDEAAQLRDQIHQADDENLTRNARIRLGEIIASAITASREADTRQLGEAVAPYAVASSVRPPSHEEDAVHVALMVETAKQQDLEQAVRKVAEDWAGHVDVRLLGPMAPYDFTMAQPAGS
jgi:Gas vesicle synthesis protein GvpL/GvpF